MTPQCPPEQMSVHCATLLRQICDRLGHVEAKIDHLAQQCALGNQAAGALCDRVQTHETRLTLLEAFGRSWSQRQRTWSARLWNLLKAATLVALGYVFKKGSQE